MKSSILNAECLAALRALPDNSADSFVTDPPYGIKFMNNHWDYDVPVVEVWAECLRVLKPGGYLLSFGGTRTYHRLATRIEDAGFVLHPMLGWIFGSGFPKATRIDLPDMDGWRYGLQSLKPAMEPIAMAQKPFSEKTGTANIARWGTGAISIDACRVEHVSVADGNLALNPHLRSHINGGNGGRIISTETERRVVKVNQSGRWPAHIIHDGSDEVLAVFPDTPGQMADASTDASARKTQNVYGDMKRGNGRDGEASADSENSGTVCFKMRPGTRREDAGSAARFFYCAKPSKKERNLGGCDNTHPTVKPVALMRYLRRLVTPTRGLIIDPYAGSGSTGIAAMLEGFDFQGFDLVDGHCQIARTRIAASGSL